MLIIYVVMAAVDAAPARRGSSAARSSDARASLGLGAASWWRVALFPLVAGNYPVKLLQEILIWGIFAMSLDLLMGYAGMVSFGHSAFFGDRRLRGRARCSPSRPGLVSALVAARRSPPASPRSSSASSRSG